MIYLDTETTGLYPSIDEILEIAIINEHGQIELNTLLKPETNLEWPEAERIHGISPEHVKDACSVRNLPSLLEPILARHDKLVIYNALFDTNFIIALYQDQDRPIPTLIHEANCAMRRYSHWIGNHRWYKLSVAAFEAGHVWQGKAHRALADCYATKTVWEYLDEQGAE